jgi:hypothetical protein
MANNHNYKEPQPGDDDWHVPINDNFEQLDKDVEIRDTEENRGNYDPKEGAKFFATDTENVFIGDGDSWKIINSSGRNPNINSLRTGIINNVVHASEFNGAGLASKVQNALEWIENNCGGAGKVRITPKSGSSSWTWDKDLVINPFEYKGIDIDIDWNVTIDYPGSGVALTLDGGGENDVFRVPSRISGGEWTYSGDPTGWLKLKDIQLSTIHPKWINWPDSGAYGISVENHGTWCEMNHISGRYEAEECIRFHGATVTGGSGTDSFQGTSIDQVICSASKYGIKLRGNFQYSEIKNPQIFLDGDEAVGIQLDPYGNGMWGMVISGGKTEEHASNTSSFELTENYEPFYLPSLVGGFYEHPTNMTTGSSLNKRLFKFTCQKGSFDIIDLSNRTSLSIRSDDFGDTWYMSSHKPVLNIGNVSGFSSEKGMLAYHDGSGSSTEGPAVYDGSSWISLIDGKPIQE